MSKDTTSYVVRVSQFSGLLETLFDEGYTLEFRRNACIELNEGHAQAFITHNDNRCVLFYNPSDNSTSSFNRDYLPNQIELLFNDDFYCVLNP